MVLTKVSVSRRERAKGLTNVKHCGEEKIDQASQGEDRTLSCFGQVYRQDALTPVWTARAAPLPVAPTSDGVASIGQAFESKQRKTASLLLTREKSSWQKQRP
jgi:hypothetical protein